MCSCYIESPPFLSTLLFSSSETFRDHLQSHSEDIKTTLTQLFEKLPRPSTPDASSLQERILALLAAEKEHGAEIDRLRTQRDLLEERLESASLRYMVAEKKLDRVKSQAVAKLEQQSTNRLQTQTGNGTTEGGQTSGPGKSGVGDGTDGADASEATAGIESARREAVAVSEKQKEQLDKLEAENENLTERLTVLTVKVGSSVVPTNISESTFR